MILYVNLGVRKECSNSQVIMVIIIIINGATASLMGFVTIRYITMWVISPTINLVLVILIQPPETSSSEAGETRVRNMAAEFCLQASFHARRVLLHAVNLRHGTDGFTSPPKEGVLWIFITLKSIVLGRV
jgi:hypothetical protein